MTSQDDGGTGRDRAVSPDVGRRTGQRRTRIAVGVAAAGAILGGGAYTVTSALHDDHTTSSRVGITHAPTSDATSRAPATGEAPDRIGSPSSSPVPTVDALGQPIPSQVVSEIQQARGKMTKDGVKVHRALAPPADTAVSDVRRTTSGSLSKGGIVRVVTAHGDLTGQQELAYVAGGVSDYRDVHCSHTFQFSNNVRPEKKPNLLMCWHTDPAKSVVAIVVDPKGHPSTTKAVEAVEKSWRTMR